MAEELHMGHNSDYDGKGVKGALWTIAGTTIGALASNVLGIGNGGGRGLFNIVGGGCGGCGCDPDKPMLQLHLHLQLLEH